MKLLVVMTLALLLSCLLAGVASLLSFETIGSEVADNGRLVEMFALLPTGLFFVYVLGGALGLGMFLVPAVVTVAPGCRRFFVTVWWGFLTLVGVALVIFVWLLIDVYVRWVPENMQQPVDLRNVDLRTLYKYTPLDLR